MDTTSPEITTFSVTETKSENAFHYDYDDRHVLKAGDKIKLTIDTDETLDSSSLTANLMIGTDNVSSYVTVSPDYGTSATYDVTYTVKTSDDGFG